MKMKFIIHRDGHGCCSMKISLHFLRHFSHVKFLISCIVWHIQNIVVSFLPHYHYVLRFAWNEIQLNWNLFLFLWYRWVWNAKQSTTSAKLSRFSYGFECYKIKLRNRRMNAGWMCVCVYSLRYWWHKSCLTWVNQILPCINIFMRGAAVAAATAAHCHFD